MAVLLQVTFNLANEEASTIPRAHAESHLEIPGLIWKIWIRDPDTDVNGGTHLFADRQSASSYLEALRARFATRSDISNVAATIFDIKEKASLITHAPLTPQTALGS
jgi:hypothetical protein